MVEGTRVPRKTTALLQVIGNFFACPISTMQDLNQKCGERQQDVNGNSQGLSQDLETGWPKLATAKCWVILGKPEYKLRLQPCKI